MATTTTPLVSSTSKGNPDTSLSYAQAICMPSTSSNFKLSMCYLVEVDGQQGFMFSEVEMTRAAEDFRHALVLKFLRVRPSIDNIHLMVVKMWGLQEIPTFSFMDAHHVFLNLHSERDFVHALAREGRVVIDGCMFRIFRWIKDFDLKKNLLRHLNGSFCQGFRCICIGLIACKYWLRGLADFWVRTMQPLIRLGHWVLDFGAKTIWQEVQYDKQGFYCKR